MKWLAAALAAVTAAGACGPKENTPRVLVLYYSQTSHTKTVAEEIALRLGADIEEIVAVDPYAEDFSATIERCNRERAEGILPEIAPVKADLSQYDVIFLGFPVWYGKAPRVILSFLEAYSFDGKTVIPFCTSDSSTIDSSETELKTTFPAINWRHGDRLNDLSVAQLKSWYESLN